MLTIYQGLEGGGGILRGKKKKKKSSGISGNYFLSLSGFVYRQHMLPGTCPNAERLRGPPEPAPRRGEGEMEGWREGSAAPPEMAVPEK